MEQIKKCGWGAKLRWLIIILILVFGAWVFAAYQFERIILTKVLPQIEKSHAINASNDSTIIDKFHFKFTLNNVNILPNSNSSVLFDKVNIQYCPFFNRVLLDLSGKDLIKIPGKDGMYSKAKNQQMIINNVLFNTNTTKFNIDFIGTNLALYSVDDDQEIISSDKFLINISNDLKDDSYNIQMNMDLDKILFSPDSKYIENFIRHHNKTILNNGQPLCETSIQIISEIIKYLYASKQEERAKGYYGKFNFRVPSYVLNENFKYFLKNDSVDCCELLTKALVDDNIKLFAHIHEVYKNQSAEDSQKTEISIDGTQVSINSKVNIFRKEYDIKSNPEYTEQLKIFIGDIFDIMHKDSRCNPNLENFDQTKLDQVDFTQLSSFLARNKELSMSLNVNFDYSKSMHFSHDLNFNVNGFKVDLLGEAKNSIYNGNITLNTPNALINNSVHSFDKVLRPLILDFSNARICNSVNLGFYDQIVNNIRTNALPALGVLHKGGFFQHDEIFNADIYMDPSKLLFNINDKPLVSYFNTPEILRFFSLVRPKHYHKKNTSTQGAESINMQNAE